DERFLELLRADEPCSDQQLAEPYPRSLHAYLTLPRRSAASQHPEVSDFNEKYGILAADAPVSAMWDCLRDVPPILPGLRFSDRSRRAQHGRQVGWSHTARRIPRA